jgi:protein SCO1/2
MAPASALRRRLCAAGGLTLGLSAWARASRAAQLPVEHEHRLSKDVKVSVVEYAVPDLWLVRDDGQRVRLPNELDDGRTVVLNFIYTTCPGVCPMMSAVFTQFQERLGATEREKVHLVSISIDPEQDTPGRLREYARRFSAGPQWQHYTGTVTASLAVQKAFNAYRGDKMRHEALTLMRPAPGKPWARIDGYASGLDLVQQYTTLAALCASAGR